jgi:dihydroxyacetone synthase
MQACGWDVIDVFDGVNDVGAIVSALEQGKDPARKKPLFVNIRTVIGVGSAVAGQAVAHGVPLGEQNVADMKKAYGWDTTKKFHIPDKVKEFYADLPSRGSKFVQEWEDLLTRYTSAHPDLAKTFKSRINGELPPNWESLIPAKGSYPETPTPTRKSNNLTVSALLAFSPTFMVGTADLTPSVNLTWPDYEIFNPPDLVPMSGKRGSYAGRYVHFGIREHLMAAVANGLAAYGKGTIVPVTSTFFMFYLYAAPAVRMGALQQLRVIHVATHVRVLSTPYFTHILHDPLHKKDIPIHPPH